MSSMTIDDNELNVLLKQALIKLLEQKNPALYDVLIEVIEEVGLVNAIQEGQASVSVDRPRVFGSLGRES